MHNAKADPLRDFLISRGIGSPAIEDERSVSERQRNEADSAQAEKLSVWNKHIQQFAPGNGPLDFAKAKELRIRAGLSTAEVGQICGLSTTTVENAEAGIQVGPFAAPLSRFIAGAEAAIRNQAGA